MVGDHIPLDVSGLDISMGGRRLFSSLRLRVLQGESVAVLGESGVG